MAELQTFHLPERIGGSEADITLADAMIRTWRSDGIFQVSADTAQDQVTQSAFESSRRFFRSSPTFKAACISDLAYSGYVASGEEVTAGEADFPEIFTLCRDIPLDDARVQQKWPCHGPVPWPDAMFRSSMTSFMQQLGAIGDKLLKLTALGLRLGHMDTLVNLTADGWHHMRVLRFPTASAAGPARGIGAHTDYGLLVIAAQDNVGGLYIRPPVEGEKRNRNWLPTESTAGMYEDQDPWHYVKPVRRVFTVFPGDILQFLTSDYLLSTPHKVRLNTTERFAMAYFHEPNFNAVVRPLGRESGGDHIHYGTHFTSMFMRCYPDRVTTRRILRENRLSKLCRVREPEQVAG